MGCMAVIGAIVGCVVGAVVGVLIHDVALEQVDDILFLVEVPLVAIGAGLFAAFVWDASVKRATRLGSPIESLRGPGQAVTVGVALVSPAIVAMALMLVAPWLAAPAAGLIIIAMVAEPAYRKVREVWAIVR